MTLNLKQQKFFQFIEQEIEKAPISNELVTVYTLRKNATDFQKFMGDECNIPKKECMIPMREGELITLRIYNAHLKSAPVMIFYPGCGYLIDTIYEANARAASRVASLVNIKIIVPQTRLVPEVSLATAINDGYDTAKFVYQHANEFDIDTKQFFISGLSSGANCAATVTRLASDNDFIVKKQILISGNYDFTRSSRNNSRYENYASFEDADKVLPQSMIKTQIDMYGLTPEQMLDPFYSPLFAKYTSNYAPTTLIVAEFDAVRSDTEAFYDCLNEQGVTVEKILLDGQSHTTFILPNALIDYETDKDPAEIIASVIREDLKPNFGYKF